MIRLALFTAALVLCAAPVAQAATNQQHDYSQKNLLRNWALARCVAKADGPGPNQDDANKTAGAYLEFGKAGEEAYAALDQLVDKYLARTYTGVHGGRFDTMKCIDLYNSRELDRLAARYAR